jgi:hypothetical protein
VGHNWGATYARNASEDQSCAPGLKTVASGASYHGDFRPTWSFDFIFPLTINYFQMGPRSMRNCDLGP